MDMSVYDQLETAIDAVSQRQDDVGNWRAMLEVLARACGQPSLRYEVWRDGEPVHVVTSDRVDLDPADAQVVVGANGLLGQLMHDRELLRHASPEQRAVWALAGSRLATAVRAHLQTVAARLPARGVAELPFLVVAGKGGVIRINAAMRDWIAVHPGWLRLVGRQIEDPRRAIERLTVGVSEAGRAVLPLGVEVGAPGTRPLALVGLRSPLVQGAVLLLVAHTGQLRAMPAVLEDGSNAHSSDVPVLRALCEGGEIHELVDWHAMVRIAARPASRPPIGMRESDRAGIGTVHAPVSNLVTATGICAPGVDCR